MNRSINFVNREQFEWFSYAGAHMGHETNTTRRLFSLFGHRKCPLSWIISGIIPWKRAIVEGRSLVFLIFVVLLAYWAMFTWVNSGKSSLSMHHPGNGTLWPFSLPISTAGSSLQQTNQSSYIYIQKVRSEIYSPRTWVIIWSTRIRQRGTWKGPLKVLPLQAGWVGWPSRRR